MRLFTALDLPPDTLLRLEELRAVLGSDAAIKWSPSENLHITTKFIGEWPEDRLNEVDAALQKLGGRDQIDIQLQDFEWYPHLDSAVALVVCVLGPALYNLAAQIDEALSKLGIRNERYEYCPHLTLARIKDATRLRSLRAKLAELPDAPIATFRASHFCLYRSDPGTDSSIYRKLHIIKFSREPKLLPSVSGLNSPGIRYRRNALRLLVCAAD